MAGLGKQPKQPKTGGPLMAPPPQPVAPTGGGGRAAVAGGGGGGGGRGGSMPYTPQVVGVGPVGGPPPGPFGSGGTPQITNTAQNNPAVQAWLEKVGSEFGGAPRGGDDPLLMEQVEELRRRRSADTTDRAVQRTTGKIKDQAAGQKAALLAGLGRRVGGDQAGLAEKLGGRVDAAAQRLAAGATADIELGRERDLDNLAVAGQGIMAAPSTLSLARSGQLQNLLGIGLGGANTLASLGLAEKGFGLQQWQAQAADERARAEMAAAERARQEGQKLALLQMQQDAAARGLPFPAGGGGGGGSVNPRGAALLAPRRSLFA